MQAGDPGIDSRIMTAGVQSQGGLTEVYFAQGMVNNMEQTSAALSAFAGAVNFLKDGLLDK